jgi:hypothetical protein
VGGAVTLLPLYYLIACIGEKKYLYAEVIHSSGKKIILEYIGFLLKNKSKKTYRKGRLNSSSELDRDVGQ